MRTMLIWLRENRTWVFNGIGVSVLTGIISLIIVLCHGRGQGPSPVANGSGKPASVEAPPDIELGGLTIDTPQDGTVLTGHAKITMEGTFPGGILDGLGVWVLARDPDNYFLMYPPAQFTSEMRKWSHMGISLATKGTWQLHVCVANRKASEWCERRAAANDWSGFPQLPEGMKSVRYVTVHIQ